MWIKHSTAWTIILIIIIIIINTPLVTLRNTLKTEMDTHVPGISTALTILDTSFLYKILEADGIEENALQILTQAVITMVRKSPILLL